MKYEGPLYGKIGRRYIPLKQTSDDIDRNEKQRDEYKHKTVVWNWLLMSDDEYRLKCGELSPQDLRNIRAVLKAMLGTSLLKHL